MSHLCSNNLPALVDDSSAWDCLCDALRALFTRHGGRLKYLPNEGNAGDALIGAGSWQFFDDIELHPEYGTLRGLRAGDAAIFGGGGNLVPEYSGCRAFLERCLAVNVASALVMPQTIRGHDDVLARLDERFTLVCRDTSSMLRAQASGTRAHLLFAPDMALYVDVARLFKRCEQYGGQRAPRTWARLAHHDRLLPYLRWRWALSRRAPPLGGHINIMRVDLEATASQRGDAWSDISHLYGSKLRLREESDLVSRDFLAFFARLSSVRTNRLHAGVAGALMGCDVTYLENSYGKIGAVYDAWLSHLPFVNFEPVSFGRRREARA
ncbi:MAG TPA: polysaccharide pyruvyl transferase family protein [Rhizobacter sp.]|nr:polysaccharide pyruvyl transferase family protein [Rhizobacter sp.]